MPIHDWMRVDAGIFHDFHHSWIEETKRALNRGLLPPDHYALAEQIAGGVGPDVLALQAPVGNGVDLKHGTQGGVQQLALTAPAVRFRIPSEPDQYARRAKAVVIRHRSGHGVVAVIEIVSPGNKSSAHPRHAFVDKAIRLLQGGVHLLIIDILPPGPRDPQGMHGALWMQYEQVQYVPPHDAPLTLASYCVGDPLEAFVEPTGIGRTLIDMPVFLTPDTYVLLPLEPTYMAAWDAVPAFWRGVIAGS